MATINPGDRFVRTRRGWKHSFECRAVQSDAFDAKGGGSAIPLARLGLRAPGTAGEARPLPENREAGALS